MILAFTLDNLEINEDLFHGQCHIPSGPTYSRRFTPPLVLLTSTDHHIHRIYHMDKQTMHAGCILVFTRAELFKGRLTLILQG